MVKLTEEEKELYTRKRNLVCTHMRLGKRVSLIVRDIITVGLTKMITNNSGEFINDMYIDFLERHITKQIMRSHSCSDDFIKSVYKSVFMAQNEDNLVKNLLCFTRYIISMYKKDEKGYLNYIESRRYSFNTMKDDDKRIFELRDYTSELMIDAKDTYTRAYNESLMKMMAYIMAHNELLLNSDLYQELLINLRDNFSIYYDNYINNSDIVDINNPDTVIYFFNPRDFITKNNEGFYKKEIK